jgi:cyclophilin family peptidyl-prolyl cis-trans isomerase
MAKATISTDKGDIEVDIFTDGAPKAAKNFLDLAKKGFYDGVIFHRVVPGFVIQGGDPTGTGRGGPGYQFEDEPFQGDYYRGTLAMANAGPNTNGSQFFIVLADLMGKLPKNYTIFGQVTKGMDVVDQIAAGRTGAQDRPVEPVKMTSVRVTEE